MQDIYCNKEFHLTFDNSSNFAKIEYTGKDHYGNSAIPNYKETFENSISELADISKMKIVYKDVHGFPSDSIIQANVTIKKIIWEFGFSSATMEVELIYELPNKKIHIFADNKVYMSGTKKGNLFKCLKNAHYQFIQTICQSYSP